MDSEMSAFFADRKSLNMDDYIVLDYFFESTSKPEEAATHLCQEMSCTQWKRVGVDEDFRPKHGAKIIELVVERDMKTSAYPILGGENIRSYACQTRIAYPVRNIGTRLPNLLTVAAGEGAFFSPGITLIKLFDIEFPKGYLEQFDGPKFGIKGIRDMLGVHDRPIFFGVIKPNIGLAPGHFAELAYESWLGGLDIAKDDEMLFDTEWSPLDKRTKVVCEARKRAEQETGLKKAYLANITDEVERLIELHDIAVKNGANMVMVNGMTTGLSSIRILRRHTDVPLVAHFDFIALMSRMPYFGLSTKIITKLQRLVGFDAILMPGFSPRMKTPEHEVEKNMDECVKPFGQVRKSLPVPGGSDWAGTLETLYKKVKTVDFGFCPGRGIFGHPMGPACGAKSLHQAWEAIRKGITIEEHSKDHPELKAAIEAFGQ